MTPYLFVSYHPDKGFREEFYPDREALTRHMGAPDRLTTRETHRRVRDELIGQPIFDGWCGPMWDGGVVRYESPAAYEVLST